MKTRILLFFVAVILLTMAPAAMAQYCKRCVPNPTLHCANAINVFGYPDCFVDETGCHLDGELCDPGASAPALASEYKVAAVERVDEPKPGESAPLVEPSETEPPPTR